jgi:tetratricopeptide (TPR) repeat protein
MRHSVVRQMPHFVTARALAVLGAALAAVLVILTSALPCAAARTVRFGVDIADVGRLSSTHPAARELLEKGEAAALAGNLDEAFAAFHQAAAQAPESPILARRECQALALLGRRSEAVQSCLRAVRNGGAAVDLRAMVGALMSGENPPTTGEVAQAMRFARRARDMMAQEPWGYAAECDIAARIGDVEMREGCLKELRRVAPGHYETVRAEAAAAPLGLTWGVWAGWAAIFALGAGTVGHAAWSAVRLRASRSRTLAAAAILLALGGGLTVSETAHAQAAGAGSADEPSAGAPGAAAPRAGSSGRPAGTMLSEWPVDDNDPESSVPTPQRRERNPLQFGYWLMDITYKAAQATRHGDHLAAIKYYKALVKAVPDRSVSFTRLCESYEAAGDQRNAAQTCSLALTRPGVTLQDYSHYFSVVLAKKGPLTDADIDALSKVLQHLREDPVGRDIVDDLDCQLAVRLEDVSRLEACTAALAAKAPNDPRTISFEWALALKHGNAREAAALIERARSTAMKPEGIDQMIQGLDTFESNRRHSLYAWTFGAIALLLGVGGALVFATRRRATPVSASSS